MSDEGARPPPPRVRPASARAHFEYDTETSSDSISTSDYPSAQFVVDQANRNRALRAKRPDQPTAATQSADLGTLPDSVQQLTLADTLRKPARVDSDHGMKSITFSGKPSQLEPCLTHCKVKILADQITEDSAKCGYLASLLRGQALNWLTHKLTTEPQILTDYEELEAQLRATFGVTEEALRLQAAKQLSSTWQKGSVREYHLRFDRLASDAGLNDATKLALFVKGLKTKVREALIIADPAETYADTVTEATRIDNEFFYTTNKRGSRGGGKHSGNPSRGTDGKFVKTNFKAEPTW